MKKPELLAPAGDLNKLIYAVLYGADAVYIGGEQFSLRTASANFTAAEMKQGVDFAHKKGARVYVACNDAYDRVSGEQQIAARSKGVVAGGQYDGRWFRFVPLEGRHNFVKRIFDAQVMIGDT